MSNPMQFTNIRKHDSIDIDTHQRPYNNAITNRKKLYKKLLIIIVSYIVIYFHEINHATCEQ